MATTTKRREPGQPDHAELLARMNAADDARRKADWAVERALHRISRMLGVDDESAGRALIHCICPKCADPAAPTEAEIRAYASWLYTNPHEAEAVARRHIAFLERIRTQLPAAFADGRYAKAKEAAEKARAVYAVAREAFFRTPAPDVKAVLLKLREAYDEAEWLEKADLADEGADYESKALVNALRDLERLSGAETIVPAAA